MAINFTGSWSTGGLKNTFDFNDNQLFAAHEDNAMILKINIVKFCFLFFKLILQQCENRKFGVFVPNLVEEYIDHG